MRCIHQFVVQPGPFVLSVQKGARLLGIITVASEKLQPPWNLAVLPVLSVMVDVEAPLVERRFITTTCDSELPDAFEHFQFVSAFTLGGFVGYLFDAGEAED